MRKSETYSCLAVDLGASSGRVIAGRFDGRRIDIEEIHRFDNGPVERDNTLYWPFQALLHQVKIGLRLGVARGRETGAPVRSIGVDSWGVDFGLLDDRGRLLGPPVHYRDARTQGVMDSVFATVSPRADIFERTGIQFLPFNTLYQLVALRGTRPEALESAAHFLMIADLVQYFLTGVVVCELTNATTTQLFDPRAGGWSDELIDRLGLPRRIFGRVVAPGTLIATLKPEVARELDADGGIQVVAVATHDTGSAVAAVPTDTDRFAYLSCGTWSLLGAETRRPVITPRALEFNFTNEGGVDGTFRLLTNIMGLWLLQESRAEWKRRGRPHSWEQLAAMAAQAEPFRSLIDPDDPSFLPPGDMPERIRAFCRDTGQPEPGTDQAVVRCVLESLSLKYRHALGRLEDLAGAALPVLHMVGGGIRNATLCQWTADACARPVVAGPVEATAIGNVGMQLRAAGLLPDLPSLRRAIRRSFPPVAYSPGGGGWDVAFERFAALTR